MSEIDAIQDLEARLQAGQAQYDEWPEERAEIIDAIEALRRVAGHPDQRGLTGERKP